MIIHALVIVVGVGLAAVEHTINFESADECYKAMDNFSTRFYRKHDRELILPPVKVSCEPAGKRA
ncbi:MAG: hypothetical protein CMI54_02360 [Parcubacteria group bacterium]|nr:hypothetical protein [Parcubacteria group bacterium]|tara:strand:- start:6681 stop:6875 length:195 start_codon:yes stop_codon:yes gene_type:complete